MILNRLIFWAMIFIFLHERWLKTSITYRRKNLGAIVDSIGKLIKSCVFVQQLQILQHVVKSRERLYLSQPTNKYRTILRQKCPGICTDAPVSQPSTIELFQSPLPDRRTLCPRRTSRWRRHCLCSWNVWRPISLFSLNPLQNDWRDRTRKEKHEKLNCNCDPLHYKNTLR